MNEQAFLTTIQWLPHIVIFIDDRIEYLQSVEKVLNEMGIDFTGYHYSGAKKIPSNLNEELAEFQIRYLSKNGIWIGDDECKKIINTFPLCN